MGGTRHKGLQKKDKARFAAASMTAMRTASHCCWLVERKKPSSKGYTWLRAPSACPALCISRVTKSSRGQTEPMFAGIVVQAVVDTGVVETCRGYCHRWTRYWSWRDLRSPSPASCVFERLVAHGWQVKSLAASSRQPSGMSTKNLVGAGS